MRDLKFDPPVWLAVAVFVALNVALWSTVLILLPR